MASLSKRWLINMITSPIQWYANQLAINRLTTLAEQPLHSKLASSQIDLSTIGLRIPRAIATLNDTPMDQRLLPPGLSLQSLRLPSGRLELREGEWTVNDKPDPRATRLVEQWRQLQAAAIKPYQPRGTPLQKIVATTADGRTLEFFVLSIQPDIIIARPDLGLQYHFADSRYYDLLALDGPAAD